jgi:membrane protein DedA with SNARE-associated domain
MTDWVYAAVPQYGVALLFLLTFLSCLALPVPASLVMLAAGAFVAAGDLPALPVLGAALAGAVLGDQVGYAAGRWGGTALWARLEARPATSRLVLRARSGLHQRAGRTVYLSRWMFSAVGPWVNLAAGATGVRWRLFTVAVILGEATWVGLYVGLGFAFAANIRAAGETMISVIGMLGAGIVALFLGRMLWRMWKE